MKIFVHKSGFLASLNPLTKLVCLVILTVMTFFSPTVLEVSFLFTVMVLLLVFNRIRIGNMKWLFIPVAASIPATLAVFILSYWMETRLVLPAIQRGCVEGFLFIGRLSILLIGNIIFVRTTDFRQLSEALSAIGLPSLPVLLLATVFRFFPVLLDEVKRVFEVQRMRGLRFRHLFIPKYWLPLALPFLIVTIQRAYELAISLYLRGGIGTTKLTKLSFGVQDALIVVAMSGIMLVPKMISALI